jgi:hypothetical protein
MVEHMITLIKQGIKKIKPLAWITINSGRTGAKSRGTVCGKKNIGGSQI